MDCRPGSLLTAAPLGLGEGLMAAVARRPSDEELVAAAHRESFTTATLIMRMVRAVDQAGFNSENIMRLMRLYECIETLVDELATNGFPTDRSVAARLAILDLFHAAVDEPERRGLLPLLWTDEFLSSERLVNLSLAPCAIWLLATSALLAAYSRIGHDNGLGAEQLWLWLRTNVVINAQFVHFAGHNADAELAAIPTIKGKFALLLQFARDRGPDMYTGPLARILDRMGAGDFVW